MIIESGLIVAAGLLLAFFKCGWRWRLAMLSHPFAMDIGIFITLNIIHMGTFSGVMVAATGSLVASALISLGRFVFGFIQTDGYYKPGLINLSKKKLLS